MEHVKCRELGLLFLAYFTNCSHPFSLPQIARASQLLAHVPTHSLTHSLLTRLFTLIYFPTFFPFLIFLTSLLSLGLVKLGGSFAGYLSDHSFLIYLSLLPLRFSLFFFVSLFLLRLSFFHLCLCLFPLRLPSFLFISSSFFLRLSFFPLRLSLLFTFFLVSPSFFVSFSPLSCACRLSH